MNILVNVKGLANKGGAERALVNLATELVRRGHKIDIMVWAEGDKRASYPLPAEVGLYHLAPTRGRWPRLGALFVRRLQADLQRHVERSDYDVVLGWLGHGGAMAGRLPGDIGPARVVAMRNLPYSIPPASRKPLKLLRYHSRQKGYRHADIVFVQMRQFRRMLPPSWQERCRVIPNAVEIPAAPIPYLEREKLVVAVSRIVSQKRLDALVQGFARFHDRYRDWKLEIWGQGTPAARAQLQTLIDERGLSESVALMGLTHDIESVYRRARILAHPSRREGMSNAVTEAMSLELAVIACADCAGMDELIVDGVTGRLIDMNAGAMALDRNLAEALCDLAGDPQHAENIGRKARDHMIENYSPQAIYDRWEEELLAAVAAHRKR